MILNQVLLAGGAEALWQIAGSLGLIRLAGYIVADLPDQHATPEMAP